MRPTGWPHARASAIALTSVLLVAIAAACSDRGFATCHEIPPLGCPRQAHACEDPSCAALYVCTADGVWRKDQVCRPDDAVIADAGQASDDATTSDAVAVDGALASRDVDASFSGAAGGEGCDDLQQPDCALATAAACGEGCCGCEEVFVCNDGGWSLWGTCESGALTSSR